MGKIDELLSNLVEVYETESDEFSAAFSDTLRVLLIGNSGTYYNNMPLILEEVSSRNNIGPYVKTSMIASGGASLKDHWNNDDTKKLIKTGNWDYVIIQEQSTFGGTYLINGEFRVADPDTFMPIPISLTS